MVKGTNELIQNLSRVISAKRLQIEDISSYYMGLMQKEVTDRIGVSHGHYMDLETRALELLPQRNRRQSVRYPGGKPS